MNVFQWLGVQWRVAVNTVINLLVPQKTENLCKVVCLLI
jgi:hypothetical protein